MWKVGWSCKKSTKGMQGASRGGLRRRFYEKAGSQGGWWKRVGRREYEGCRN
jgi:hypothetical protein